MFGRARQGRTRRRRHRHGGGPSVLGLHRKVRRSAVLRSHPAHVAPDTEQRSQGPTGQGEPSAGGSGHPADEERASRAARWVVHGLHRTHCMAVPTRDDRQRPSFSQRSDCAQSSWEPTTHRSICPVHNPRSLHSLEARQRLSRQPLTAKDQSRSDQNRKIRIAPG